jgi:hypothetical protein
VHHWATLGPAQEKYWVSDRARSTAGDELGLLLGGTLGLHWEMHWEWATHWARRSEATLGPALGEALGRHWADTHSGTSWVLHSVLPPSLHTEPEGAGRAAWQPLGDTTGHTRRHWAWACTGGKTRARAGRGAGCNTGTALGELGQSWEPFGDELELGATLGAVPHWGQHSGQHLGSTRSGTGEQHWDALGQHWEQQQVQHWERSVVQH